MLKENVGWDGAQRNPSIPVTAIDKPAASAVRIAATKAFPRRPAQAIAMPLLQGDRTAVEFEASNAGIALRSIPAYGLSAAERAVMAQQARGYVAERYARETIAARLAACVEALTQGGG